MKRVSKKIKTLISSPITAPLSNEIITCQLFSVENTSAGLLFLHPESVRYICM